MSDGAPVCLISRSQRPPSNPVGARLPNIPRAQDLPSAIQAINALTLIIQTLSGFLPPFPRNNLSIPTVQSLRQPSVLEHNSSIGPTTNINEQKGGNPKDQKPQKSRWEETDRTTELVKIVNPDDSSQFVIVERINSITFSDSVTHSTMVWHR